MDIQKLKGSIPDSILNEIPSIMEKFSINTPLRLAHFLGQTSHESGNFKVFSENLNYSAEGLTKVFKKYFPSIDVATPYARNPQKIANKVYSNRIGNGDETSGDGYNFRGRGSIQLTGKSNYMEFDKIVNENIIANPDLVATKYPLLSAAWFWNRNNLNTKADLGATDDVVTKVTKVINGGTIGLDGRIAKFNLFYSKLKTV